MLVVENLYKSYLPKGTIAISGCGTSLIEKAKETEDGNDNKFAVNGFSFTLKKHEVLAVLGENGSGKSTLLKLLAGLLDADAGHITLNKKEITGPSRQLVAGHANIKLIHQNYNLFPNISLAENILYPLRFLAKEYQQKRLTELLELCNLEDIKDKLPRHSSGGEQQRAAIATALATDTDILLLDEPFSNLDIFNKTELKEHFRKIAQKGNVGILFVTHDAHDALSVSDKIIVVKNGGIIQSAKPDQLYFSPVNPYTAQITGINNVFEIGKLRKIFGERLPDPTASFRNKQFCAIRPEFITLTGDIRAIVKSVAFSGFYYLINVTTDSGLKISVYSSESLVIGETVFLSIDFEKLYVFPDYRFAEIKYGSAAYKDTVLLRDNILRRPLNLHFSEQELKEENNQHHLALYNHDNLIACLCLVPAENKTLKMRQVAVKQDLQSIGIGSMLVREAENFARTTGFSKIILHARETVVDFYVQLGYHMEGKKFEEVGITHVKMAKALN